MAAARFCLPTAFHNHRAASWLSRAVPGPARRYFSAISNSSEPLCPAALAGEFAAPLGKAPRGPGRSAASSFLGLGLADCGWAACRFLPGAVWLVKPVAFFVASGVVEPVAGCGIAFDDG